MADASQSTRSTLGDYREPATICRERGWTVGTQIVGDEGHGPTVIEITAIGEKRILAKTLSHNGRRTPYREEAMWTLDCRDWKEREHG